ncbi:MAG: DUF92 domain-containing protein [Thermotogota bacterium]
MNLIIGLILGLMIAFVAYKKNALSKSGTVAATLLGISLYYFGGLYFFLIMISFFISSTLLTKYKKKKKIELEKIHDKTGRRDYTQVLANSLPAIIYALFFYYTRMNVFLLGFATTFSATNSDTWASELGVLSKNDPSCILTGKRVQKGMSGGITKFGTFASFLGALFLSFVFMIGYIIKFQNQIVIKDLIILSILTLIGGFLGSIIDSLLGASIQGIYKHRKTNELTEKRFDEDEENKLIRGFKFIDNNLVNLLSSLTASLLMMLIYIFV